MEINKIICGDCIEVMKSMPKNSVDSVVTDPPYGLEFMSKSWDTFKQKGVGPNSYQEWTKSWATECLRVLKPGGYLLSFGGTRTYHRMTCAIEDAGFEIRDCIMWVYGSGFPKSLNIGKQIDKTQGKATDKSGSEWEGWGTGLKPAVEPIVVARKSLSEKNVASNVLKWGTGGINIDESKIGDEQIKSHHASKGIFANREPRKSDINYYQNQGRFPANLILECICDEAKEGKEKKEPYSYKGKSYQVEGFIKNNKPQAPSNYNDMNAGVIHTNPNCPCYILDRQSGKVGAFAPVKAGQKGFGGVIYGKYKQAGDDGKTFYGDGLSGASRFFYVAKASRKEKGYKNCHPTVKPIKLMEYLVRLVTPSKGIVLDPFLGSGTTAIVCKKLGFNWIGIEKEEEYCKIAEARINAVEELLI